jgi:dihydroorotate dehydrogenase (fumarate)
MEQAGASAVVLHSLFEEQLPLESQDLARNLLPEGYLEHIRQAKALLKIPIIASLNGTSQGGWVRYAREIEEAGADALELNLYYIPSHPDLTGLQVEHSYYELVRRVRNHIRIPVAVKLSPFFSALANLAQQLASVGTDGLVLFNRFYQPDFDLENLEVVPSLTLSTPQELLLRLHWVAILHGAVRADLAITGGIHSAEDVLKAMMAGARVAMMTSALLKFGIEHLASVRDQLMRWMQEHDYDSIRQMQGSMSYRAVADPAPFERANYMKVLRSYALRTPGNAQRMTKSQ